MLFHSCTRNQFLQICEGPTPTPGTIELDPDRWTIYPERAALEYNPTKYEDMPKKSFGWKVVVMRRLNLVNEVESQYSLEGCGDGRSALSDNVHPLGTSLQHRNNAHSFVSSLPVGASIEQDCSRSGPDDKSRQLVIQQV